ncbi:MAG: hypothetical protein IJ730_01125 [Alphaproteobacteria bacterium]|nr:hypothetical protein [Alphaproteobacteria bacterium]
MATKFTFPKAPQIGDRIEIVSISENKLQINLVGNSEAVKNLVLVFPDQTFSGAADGTTPIATITEKNTVYTFKCVTAKDVHTWLLEGTCLNSKIKSLENRIEAIETALEAMVGE